MRFSERKKDLTQVAKRVSGVRDYNRTARTRRRLGLALWSVCFAVPRIEPRDLHTLDKCSTDELHLSPTLAIFLRLI